MVSWIQIPNPSQAIKNTSFTMKPETISQRVQHSQRGLTFQKMSFWSSIGLCVQRTAADNDLLSFSPVAGNALAQSPPHPLQSIQILTGDFLQWMQIDDFGDATYGAQMRNKNKQLTYSVGRLWSRKAPVAPQSSGSHQQSKHWTLQKTACHHLKHRRIGSISYFHK